MKIAISHLSILFILTFIINVTLFLLLQNMLCIFGGNIT